MADPGAVSDEKRLKEKPQAIEALFAGATTPGERDAAGAARQRIIQRIAQLVAETPIESQFTSLNTWGLRLLLALTKRYGLKPYRYKRQRRTTLVVRASEPFLRDVFIPEFERMTEVLFEHLDEVAKRVIAEVLETEPPPPPEEKQWSLLSGSNLRSLAAALSPTSPARCEARAK